MAVASRDITNFCLQFCWISTFLVFAVGLEGSRADQLLDNFEGGIDSNKALPSFYSRNARAPRLRFVKKTSEEPSIYDREARAPRVRYYKRSGLAGSPDFSFDRDARAPRLRFVKRFQDNGEVNDSFFERDAKAPRLRFVKRSAARATKIETRSSETKSNQISKETEKVKNPKQRSSSPVQETKPHKAEAKNLRKRRSISPLGLTKRRLSIDNDIRAIANMIYYEETRRRVEEENRLRKKLLETGKRSSSSGSSEISEDLDSPEEVSDSKEKDHVVRALANTLVDYALT